MKFFRGAVAAVLTCTLLTGCGLNGAGRSSEAKYEGDGFKTAEAAATSFVEGLRDLDYNKMLKSYAWETQAEHYKYESELDRFDSFIPTMPVQMPSDNDFYISANASGLQSIECRRLYCSIAYYLMKDDVEKGMVIPLKDEESMNDFLSIYDNERYKDFTKIKNLRFVSPEEVLGDACSMDEYNEKAQINYEHYGADEVVSLAALADVGDKTFYYFPTVARYGDKWYVVSSWSLISSYLQMDAYTPFKITNETPKDWINKQDNEE
ncbi:hypothetical protein D6856_10550 [Butyrivibrio sp. XB500-5]|uniref:LptM family lipoprotein n=1 Tax=Butyrivibrio sp. XB500-5 TaxID=2364880 RepID=UPI000EA9D517|nr:hypothetical protein [Butyrivibrio sp. XB500-5]RKM59644.1 hypothetical protein D6856_10550 [Butyrivibrio sp. XB500-5]